MNKRQRYPRAMFDVLESRVLLSSTLLDIPNVVSMVSDTTRNQIDIISSDGIIHRYDAAHGKMLSDIVVPQADFGSGDITPDGKYLLVGDSNQSKFYKIDLTSSGYSSYTYDETYWNNHPLDITVVSDTQAFFRDSNDGSRVRSLNIVTGSTALMTGTLSLSFSYPTMVRSQDRQEILLGGRYVYSVQSGVLTDLGAPQGSYDHLLNADGTLMTRRIDYAFGNDATEIMNIQTGLNVSLVAAGAVYFSPVQNVLYVMQDDSSILAVYDAQTFKQIALLDAGEKYSSLYSNTGSMAVSADGKKLLIRLQSGIHVLNVDPSKFTRTTLSASAHTVTQGTSVKLTATISGQQSYSGKVVFSDGQTILGTASVKGNTATITLKDLPRGFRNIVATYTSSATGIESQSSIESIVVSDADTPSNFFPVQYNSQMIEDAAHNRLIFVTSDGNLLFYDLAEKKVTSSIAVNGMVGTGDITSDGKYLLLPDTVIGVIYKVDLTTGTVARISYSKAGWSVDERPNKLVILSNGLAVFGTGRTDDNKQLVLHALDISSGTVSSYPVGTLSDKYSNNVSDGLLRTADRNTIIINKKYQFDVASKTLTLIPITQSDYADISGDGSRIAAIYTYTKTISIYDSQGNLLQRNLSGDAACFSPVYDTIYILSSSENCLKVYDSKTFALKNVIPVGSDFYYADPHSYLDTTSDGKTLFITARWGVYRFNVDESSWATVSLASSSGSVAPGRPMTLTATLSGLPQYDGSVTFKDGDTVLAKVDVTNGQATYVVNSLAAGAHTITATYIAKTTGVESGYAKKTILALASADPAQLISVSSHADIISDTLRNQQIIIAENGDIYRYSLDSQEFLDVYHIDAKLGRGDITVDGHYLYITDQDYRVIYKLDLESGTYQNLYYKVSDNQRNGALDLVILSDNRAIFSCDSYSGSNMQLCTIDLQTDTISIAASGGLSTLYERQLNLVRSADRKTLLIISLDNYDQSLVYIYDVTKDQYITTGVSAYRIGASVSRDDSLAAVGNKSVGFTYVYDSQGNIIQDHLPLGAVCFSQKHDTLFIYKANTSQIFAYDTTTWTLQAVMDTGDKYEPNPYGISIGTGTMSESDDGTMLFVATNHGTCLLNVDQSHFSTTTLAASACVFVPGRPFTLDITLGGQSQFAGSVVIRDGDTVLATLSATSSTLSYNIKSLAQGVHHLTASFIDAATGIRSISNEVLVVAYARAQRTNLLPLNGSNDIITDAPLNQLLFIYASGDIVRYDLTTNQISSILHVDGTLGKGDVSIDGKTLYLTDSSIHCIHQIDLLTGTQTVVDIGVNATDLVVVSDTLAIFSHDDRYASNPTPLHTLNLSTGETAVYKGTKFASYYGTSLSISADRNVLIIDQKAVYDIANDSLKTGDSTSYAVSPDGNYIAYGNTYNYTTVWDSQFQTVKSNLQGGIPVFSPDSSTLYVFSPGIRVGNIIYAYDTTNFASIGDFDIGERLTSDSWSWKDNGQGRIFFSADGQTLLAVTDDGVRIMNVKAGAPPQPVIAASTVTPAIGQPVEIKASLPDGSGFWTGSYTFSLDGQEIGSAAIDGTGNASLKINLSTAGAHQITAVLTSSSGSKSAVSQAFVLQVSSGQPPIQLTCTDQGTLTRPPSFSVAVADGYSVMATGSVEFYDGNTLLDKAWLVEGKISGTFELPLSAGDHHITAVYSGDDHYLAVTSEVFDCTIRQLATTTVLSAASPWVAPTESLTLKAVVTSETGQRTTGYVSFYDGTTLLGSAVLDEQGIARLTVKSFATVGTHHLRAVMAGSTAFAGSQSDLLDLIVRTGDKKVTSTIAIAANGTFVEVGGDVTLTATISTPPGNPPTGTVSFYEGKKLLAAVAVDAGGTATYHAAGLVIGTHAIRAVYSGSVRVAGSSSSEIKVKIYEPVTVDLLAVYTAAAFNATDEAIESIIAGEVEKTNQAMRNSQIPIFIRLVGMEQVTGTERNNYADMLEDLHIVNDGNFDTVPELRKKYHADLVTLFVSRKGNDSGTNSVLGMSDLPTKVPGNYNDCYTVVDAMNTTDYVLAHEIGHNFGARHTLDRDTPGVGFTNGRGYYFYGTDVTFYHDIMAYPEGNSQLIPYYSNPDVLYEGVHEGTSKANAAGVMSQMAVAVSCYSDYLSGPVAASAPTGAIVGNKGRTIYGWGLDPNLGGKRSLVRVDIDGVTGTPFYADLYNSQLEDESGFGFHGFKYDIPANVSGGEHTVTLYVQDSSDSNFVQVDSQTVEFDSRPDLAVSIGTLAKPLTTYVPGDTITLPVTITNTGVTASDSPIKVTLRMSSDDALDNSDTIVSSVTISGSIAAGASRVVNIKVPLTSALAAGKYFLLAQVEFVSSAAETTQANNVAASSQIFNYEWKFGNIDGRGNVALNLKDADGTQVTLKLTGQGVGTLSQNADGYDIELAGTNGKSGVSVSTTQSKNANDNGRFTLRDLTVGTPSDAADHTSLGFIKAATTDLTGDFAITGTLSTLTLGNAISGSEIYIGAPGTGSSVPQLNITLGKVSDLSILSDIGINQITAIDWESATSTTDMIQAAWLNKLKITGNAKQQISGNFDADISLSGNSKTSLATLGAVTIAGQILAGTWSVAGSVGSITAQAINAGWHGDFSGAQGNIGTIKLTDSAATNTLTIHANAIQTLTVSGGLKDSSLILDQNMSRSKKALGTLTVTGDLATTEIRSVANIGSITARALVHSGIYVGVPTDLTGLPTGPSDFNSAQADALPSIGLLKLIGFGRGVTTSLLVNSIVAAGFVTKVSFARATADSISADGSSDKYGFATLFGVQQYTGPDSVGAFISGRDSVVS